MNRHTYSLPGKTPVADGWGRGGSFCKGDVGKAQKRQVFNWTWND